MGNYEIEISGGRKFSKIMDALLAASKSRFMSSRKVGFVVRWCGWKPELSSRFLL